MASCTAIGFLVLAGPNLFPGKRGPVPVVLDLYVAAEVIGLRMGTVPVIFGVVRIRVDVDVAGRGGIAETSGLFRAVVVAEFAIEVPDLAPGVRKAAVGFKVDTDAFVMLATVSALFSVVGRKVLVVDEEAVAVRGIRLAVALEMLVVDGVRAAAADFKGGMRLGATAGALLPFASVESCPGILGTAFAANLAS